MDKRLAQLLRTLTETENALAAEMARQFPEGTVILAKVQSNRGPDRVTVDGVVFHNPRRLCVRYASGHRTTVHVTDVVGTA